MNTATRSWQQDALAILLGTAVGLGAAAFSSVPGPMAGAVVPTAERSRDATASRAPHDPPSAAPSVAAEGEPDANEALGDVLADIAALQDEIEDLLADANGTNCPDPKACAWYQADQATLDEWARCAQLPLDVPPALLTGSDPWFSDDSLLRVDATQAEREEIARKTTDLSTALQDRLAKLHEELTGSEHASELPTHVLIREIRGMAAVADPEAEDRRRVAQERAQRIVNSVPDEGGMVGYHREMLRVGDETERILAEVLGPERAGELRAASGGWGARMTNEPRCPSGE